MAYSSQTEVIQINQTSLKLSVPVWQVTPSHNGTRHNRLLVDHMPEEKKEFIFNMY